jgi:hypothetical protein
MRRAPVRRNRGASEQATLARVLTATLIAGICALVLATRVFVAFEPIRVRVVREPAPAAAGVVRIVSQDDRLRALRPPAAVIVRVRSESASPQRFTIRLDGRPVCTVAIPAAATRRRDCAATELRDGPGARDIVVESASPDPWTLDYLELATHHGRSTGVLHALILPAAAQYGRMPLGWVVLGAVALFFLLLLPFPAVVHRAWRVLLHGLGALVLGLFATTLMAPVFSPYVVALSAWTFAGAVSILVVPRLWPDAASAANAIGRRLIAHVIVPVAMRAWTIALDDRFIAFALATAVGGVGIVYGPRAVGGHDEYVYVSQADLWLRGDLSIDQHFAREAPWPDAEWSFAPLGYRPGPVDDLTIVPVNPPGFPMLLAAAKLLGGQTAMFVVVPLCAFGLVLATYGIGRQLGSRAAGAIGAALVATSPIVLFMTVSTMTDVPVAAAWVGAIYLLMGTTAASAAGAGLLSGLAVLIRPNLVPLVAVLALQYLLRMRNVASRRRAFGHLLAFGSGVLPGIAAVALTFHRLYGSPFASGYGELELFVPGHILTNLRTYFGWLVEAHTPAVALGLVPLVVPLRRFWPGAAERSVFVVAGAFIAVLWILYCAWGVFDAWWFTRFLLASWPFIMVGVGAIVAWMYGTRPVLLRLFAVGLVIGVAAFQIRFAVGAKVFEMADWNRRFVGAAWMIRRTTERNSVVLSMQHSGSLRYYAGILTINYLNLQEEWLDDAVKWLTGRGLHVYAALDDWEVAHFRQRFVGSRRLSALDRPPVAIYRMPGEVRVYDLSESRPPAETVIDADVDLGWRAVPPVNVSPRLILPR